MGSCKEVLMIVIWGCILFIGFCIYFKLVKRLLLEGGSIVLGLLVFERSLVFIFI